MQIIPVIDILDSRVVRGVAGNRDQYRPITSSLTDSVEPVAVAAAFRDLFGLSTLYVADLDAILHAEPNFEVYEDLSRDGFELLIDAGVRSIHDVEPILRAGASKAIVGLETWPLLSTLEMMLQQTGGQQVIFSLDLQSGRPVRRLSDVVSDDPIDIGCAVIEAGIREMIVLDLAAVGVASGPVTLDICRALKEFAPKLKLITGGGIRSTADLSVLRSHGIDGAMVASSLHDGGIKPDQLSP